MSLRLRKKDWAVLALGAAMVAGGVVLALLTPPDPPADGPGQGHVLNGPDDGAPQEKARETPPELRGFAGDLKRGGQLVGHDSRGRDVVEPFVIGATCAWCVSSALVMAALLVGTTGELGRGGTA